MYLLKKIIDYIKNPLTLIINQAFQTGRFPDVLKISKIKPIYKKNDPQILDNYRPISLLPCISKVFEKAMYIQIYSHFQTNNLFFNNQYGFREGHSTQLAALELHSRVHDALNSKENPFCLFLDLSKAFDLIDYKILLDKLKCYGFSDMALKLCHDYLSNRKQFVEFGNEQSDMISTTRGIAQGSILGPLYFLIYINDFYTVTSKFSYIIYADDTSLYSTLEAFDSNNTGDINLISHNINSELSKVLKWLETNKLQLNVSKTKLMCFRVRQKTLANYPDIQLGDECIHAVSNFSFLGIIFDEYLSWSVHTKNLSIKLSKSIGIMNRLKNEVPFTVLKIIFNSLFNSHINYGLLIWGYNGNSISQLQKKAIQTITKQHRCAHTEPLLKCCNILNFKGLIETQELKFYFKYENQLLPQFFYEQFLVKYESTHYNTRQIMIIKPIVSRLSLSSLRYNIAETVNSCKPLILEKVYTHCLDGFSKYYKNDTLDAYTVECHIENCYSCQVSRVISS